MSRLSKILIVEDEPYERLRLKEQISDVYGQENVREAESVEKAINAVNSWRPDLILLDIKLKGRSGFEIVGYVRKEYPMIEIIIITAYNEFEYARKALSFRIKYYLSKPVRPSVMMDTIREALYKDKVNTYLLSQPIWRLLESGQHIQAKSSIGFNIKTVLVAGFENSQGELDKFNKYIYSYFDKYKRKVELMDKQSIIYIDKSFEELSFTLNKLCDDFVKIFTSEIVIGIDQTAENIASCYLNAIAACNHKIFYPDLRVIEFKNVERKKVNSQAYPITAEQKLINKIKKGDSDKIEDALHQFVSDMVSSSNNSYPVLRTWVESLYNSLKRMCISEGLLSNEISIIKPGLFWFSEKHLKQDIRDFINRIVRLLEGRARPEHPVIAKAVDYMLENYKHDISLSSLSKRLAISPGYFSRLFKEEVGIPFKRYLMDIRIFRAKELLLKSSLAISEIASEVGYQDPNYFSEAFKKYEGVSPSKYREINGIS